MNLVKIFQDIPTIEAKTVNLRKLKSEDAYDLFQYYKNENLHQYLDWNGPESVEHADRIIEIWNKGFEQGWIIRFAIAEKVTNRIIGTIFLNNFEGKRAEVGYELSEEYWKKGIMSEAMQEVLNLGFNQLELTRIQAFFCKENTASKKLLVKFGFQEEGYLRQYECHEVTGKCKDMYIYGLLKEEFSAKSNYEFRELKEHEIETKLFEEFNRYQEVKKCWRKEDNQWILKDIVFTEQWSINEYNFLVECLKNTVNTGGVVVGAFYEDKLIGFGSLENEFFGSNNEYLQLSSIHISYEQRGKGFGKELFSILANKAKENNAKKLYISAHSSEETQNFYKKIGCVEALEYNDRLVSEEPCDCQLEYSLV